MQSRNRDTSVGSKHGYQEGQSGWDGLKIGIDVCSVPCGDLNGKEIQGKEDIWTCLIDSIFCTAETNTTL